MIIHPVIDFLCHEPFCSPVFMVFCFCRDKMLQMVPASFFKVYSNKNFPSHVVPSVIALIDGIIFVADASPSVAATCFIVKWVNNAAVNHGGIFWGCPCFKGDLPARIELTAPGMVVGLSWQMMMLSRPYFLLYLLQIDITPNLFYHCYTQIVHQTLLVSLL